MERGCNADAASEKEVVVTYKNNTSHPLWAKKKITGKKHIFPFLAVSSINSDIVFNAQR